MKHRLGLPFLVFFLTLSSTALANTTWYVDGVNGSDSNNCKTHQHACKTIGHAISLASSGDSILVGAATYTENLTVGFSLRIVGSGANTTIIDGGGNGRVVTIPNTSTHVTLSKLTIRNGAFGGNFAFGAGILNLGTLMINRSTISGNGAAVIAFARGGGILNGGTLTINNSTVSGNGVEFSHSSGSGINNGGTATLQNSIVANNIGAGNCSGTMTSNGYNLSSDRTCNFNNTGDLNNTDPKLGQLGYYGGATQTIPLLSGSPAIDAGNPNGCTDSQGHPLKTDQRGKPRPDNEDSGGCDMGAYERQKD